MATVSRFIANEHYNILFCINKKNTCMHVNIIIVNKVEVRKEIFNLYFFCVCYIIYKVTKVI